ncbi:MAG: cytochrome C [Bacteroidota bacterium]
METSLVLSVFICNLGAQISPGELSRQHAHLEGLTNCTKCHILGEKVSNEKCLDCHLEIGVRIAAGSGFHSSTEVKGKACIECHSDHHGKNFQMIRFDTDQFNHALAGYDLQGAHAGITCRNCHKTEYITDPEIKAKASSYLGLDQKCLSCHTDHHMGTLPSDCASCHDFKAFKPASKFDHMEARFPLRGRHAQVDCKLCHKIEMQNGREVQQFTGLVFGKCTNCHKDVHENKFGQNCTQCHSEVSFQQVKGIKNFNHALTSYPLEGKHSRVACAGCHKSGYSEELKHNRCSDCHTDYHKNQFMSEGQSPDCAECHSIRGFEQTSFTIEKHNDGSFQLTGAHLATPCFDCPKNNDNWSFRQIGLNCKDCHQDVHGPTLAKKYDPEPFCVNCHSTSRWSDIAFDHTKTGYTLGGAHSKQACKSCHFKNVEQGLPVRQFTPLTSACTGCHKDAHQKQFEESKGTTCLKCHDYFDWSAGLFNHDKTAFPLDGKHEQVACARCHPKVTGVQNTYTLYKLNSTACESCH